MPGFISHPLRTFESGAYVHQTSHLYAGFIGHRQIKCSVSGNRTDLSLSPHAASAQRSISIEPASLQFPCRDSGRDRTVFSLKDNPVFMTLGAIGLDLRDDSKRPVWPFMPAFNTSLPGLKIGKEELYDIDERGIPVWRADAPSVRFHKNPFRGPFSVNFMVLLAGTVPNVGSHGMQLIFASVPENAADPKKVGRALKECRNPVSSLGLFSLQSFSHRANTGFGSYIEVR